MVCRGETKEEGFFKRNSHCYLSRFSALSGSAEAEKRDEQRKATREIWLRLNVALESSKNRLAE